MSDTVTLHEQETDKQSVGKAPQKRQEAPLTHKTQLAAKAFPAPSAAMTYSVEVCHFAVMSNNDGNIST
jgi:hypothetical protein